MKRSGAEQETLPLDEIALAGAEHLDPKYVASYDRKTGSDPSFEIHEVELLREVGLERESTLVDLGAGTGTLAIAAAQHCARVIAVDVSPAMLAAIERKAEKQGISNVKCVQAGFLSYDHTVRKLAYLLREFQRLRKIVDRKDASQTFDPIAAALSARVPNRPKSASIRACR